MPYQKYVYFAHSPQDIILALGNSFVRFILSYLYISMGKCVTRVNCILKSWCSHEAYRCLSKFVMINELRKFQTQKQTAPGKLQEITIHIFRVPLFLLLLSLHLVIFVQVNNTIGNKVHTLHTAINWIAVANNSFILSKEIFRYLCISLGILDILQKYSHECAAVHIIVTIHMHTSDICILKT